jgi:hypothetical protein
MPDYGIRMLVEPEDWSPYRYQLKQAWLVIRARADSIQAAAELMNQEIARDGWRIIRKEECGVIDVSQSSNSAMIEAALAAYGVFSEFHTAPPPPTQRFSKN